MATPHPTEKATKRLLSTFVLVFLIFLLHRTGDVCFAAVHGLSTTTAFTHLPEVLLWSPDGFPRLGAGAAAHLCASGMGELGACFCCQAQCCVSRSSVTRNSEKHLGSQIAGKKKHCSEEKCYWSESFIHDSWAARHLKYFCDAFSSKNSVRISREHVNVPTVFSYSSLNRYW